MPAVSDKGRGPSKRDCRERLDPAALTLLSGGSETAALDRHLQSGGDLLGGLLSFFQNVLRTLSASE